MIHRRLTRQINVGGVLVGGDAPITVQSMTTTDTRDVDATVAQVNALQGAGAEIVRLAVPDQAGADALAEIVARTSVPLVADIHFDYRLALASVAAGVAMLRINPGNIGKRERIEAVVAACLEKNVPIRIGINTGSLEKRLLEKYGSPTPEAMVESATDNVRLLEDLGFTAIKVSLKASDVPRTVAANRLFSAESDIPLHLGVTEAGTVQTGAVRSAVGLGILLAEGIGDTIRVSLTGDPLPEVRVGWDILKALEIRERGITITSCPNCGRLERPIEEVIGQIEAAFDGSDVKVHIAVMGCSVNGPGESRQADIGVIAAPDGFLLYKKGSFWKKVAASDVLPAVHAAVAELAG
jgi:(E)-4-hydroxy-3-methylbut-2-enyl-diphosphate synthase